MKNVEITWSHIVSRKMASLRDDRGLTQSELAEDVGVMQNYISAVLSRQKKGTIDFFTSLGKALGLSEKETEDLLVISMFEAIETEYPRARSLLSKF